MNEFFDFSGRDSCEVVIRKTWNEFRQKLSDKKFAYDDVETALQTVFLKTFDDMFQNTHQHLDKLAMDVLSNDTCVMKQQGSSLEIPSWSIADSSQMLLL